MKRSFLKVFQKVNIVRCFALVLAVLCLVLVNGERVKAADISAGPYRITYEGVEYYFFLGNFEQPLGAEGKKSYKVVYDNPENKVAFWCYDSSDNEVWVLFYDYTGASFNVSYSYVNDDGNSGEPVNLSYTTPQYRGVITNYFEDPSIFPPDFSGIKAKTLAFCQTDVFQRIVNPPPELDFNSALDASWVWIEDFRADLENDVLYMTWGEFKSTLIQAVDALKQYENRYIGFAGIFIDERYDSDKSYNDMIVTDVVYTDYTDYEGSLTFEAFGVPDGYRLWYLHAYPFWYWDDDISGHLQKGKSSMITFDVDGNSSDALIKNKDDIYNPIDPDFSNWNAITNFTGNYFQNMQQTFNNTFQNYDASGMDDNTGNLEDGLKNYSNAQDVILDDVAANIAQYNPADYLNFTDSVMVAMGLVSGWINMFLNVSGEFTVVFIVGCVMVVFFVVLGIWRFQ